VVLVCCVCDFLLPVPVGLALAGTIYGSWSVWLAIRESRSTVLHVNPVVTFQMWQAGTLGLSPLYIGLKYSAEDLVPFGSRVVLPAQIAYGHAILVVGAFALYLGMKQFQPKDAIRESGDVRASSGWELLTYFVAGTAILIFSYQITATMGSVFAGLSTMPLAVLLLFAVKPPAGLLRSRATYWAVLVVGTMILLLLHARGDSKMMLSFSFVPLAMAAVQRRRKGLLIAFGVGFIGFYLLVIAPLVGEVRSVGQRDEYGGMSALNGTALGNVRVHLETEFRDDPIQYLSSWFEITLYRLGDPVAAGVVSEFVANGGLLRGAGMDYVPMAFIPRLLWHDKPVIERGRYFTYMLGMSSDEMSAATSTGQTAAGELYWNFGWPGVVVGMYILGAAFSGAWWGAAGGNPTHGILEMTAFTGITLSFVLGAGSAAGTGFVGAIASGLVLRALIYVRDLILRRRRKIRTRRCCSNSPIPVCR
jgi:hypothetical protein